VAIEPSDSAPGTGGPGAVAGAGTNGSAASGTPVALPHVDSAGRARMVDVGEKPLSERSARARATLRASTATCAALADGGLPKGDAIAVARLAGIQAAKRTAELVPLAHPLPLAHVDVAIAPEPEFGRVSIEATARAHARTGVELEALVACTTAAVALYDMVKAVEPGAAISDARVIEKRGGRSGIWRQEPALAATPDCVPVHLRRAGAQAAASVGTCALLVVSTRAASGARPDRAEPHLRALAHAAGLSVARFAVLPDDPPALAAFMRDCADRQRVAVVLTSGGTGLTADDRTPEATLAVADREVPGIAELVRAHSFARTPLAALSRAVAAMRGRTLIVNLPGNPSALVELREPLAPVLRHAVELLAA